MAFELTDEQRSILRHDPCNHARILAGPGTGKSTILVALADTLHKRDKSLHMKILTFTRATTAELAHKIALQSQEAERPSTIHSFAISILLQNPGIGGFPEPLRIADTWEMKNVVEPTLAKRLNIQVPILRKLLSEMASNWESLTEVMDLIIDAHIRKQFQKAWIEHRQMLGYTLLQELPYALHRVLNNRDYLEGIHYDILLVDEYQDLNACDLEVLKILSNKSGCAVIGTGDDDQSIYSWRKAAPDGIRRFLDDYKGAVDYTLSVTLRCGRRIIEWANHIIQADPHRPSDRRSLCCSDDAPDGEVALLSFRGDKSEARGVAKIVKGLIETENIEPSDIIVLMRTDHNRTFSQPIRDAIEKLGITCSDQRYVLELLDNPSNRRLLEVFRLLAHRNDSLAWTSLLKLTVGIGDSFLDYIYKRAKSSGKTFASELLSAYQEGFPDGPRIPSKRAAYLITHIVEWLDSNTIPDEKPSEGWGNWIIDMSGGSVVPLPTQDLQELLHQIDGISEEGQKLSRFLSQIEPLGKDLTLAQSNAVRLMTMGGSKGLTTQAAIIVGVEKGLVPRPGCDLSEECRILYVAMTRAKKYLYCTWAGRRRGPTARAGKPISEQRYYSNFIDGGPVSSQDGETFICERF